jgi:uncharacterized protein YndB with AHSA1/START domain
MSKALIVRNTIKLNADVDRAWDALTDPTLTKRYMFGCEVVSDWKVGSPILWKAFSDGQELVHVKGSIVGIQRKKRLEYTVIGSHTDYDDVPANYTTVTYELTPQDKQTVLSVAQGDFARVADGQKRYNDCIKGWESALNGLKELLNKPVRR